MAKTKPTINFMYGLSYFKCMKYVSTKNDFMHENINAPATVYSPSSILVIQIDEKVSAIKAIRITTYTLNGTI